MCQSTLAQQPENSATKVTIETLLLLRQCQNYMGCCGSTLAVLYQIRPYGTASQYPLVLRLPARSTVSFANMLAAVPLA